MARLAAIAFLLLDRLSPCSSPLVLTVVVVVPSGLTTVSSRRVAVFPFTTVVVVETVRDVVPGSAPAPPTLYVLLLKQTELELAAGKLLFESNNGRKAPNPVNDGAYIAEENGTLANGGGRVASIVVSSAKASGNV